MAAEGLESAAEIVGCREVRKMGAELVLVVVMEPLDGRLLDRAVHPLDLAIRPRVLHLGQSVLDLMLPADAVKYVFESIRIAASICKLHAVVGQHPCRR